MKTILVVFTFLAGLTTSAQAIWKADKAHSRVGFEITHLMISEVDGRFEEFDVTATANDSFDNPEFEVTIKTASVDTDNSRRDEHLRGEDYFDANSYPTIYFKSNGSEKKGDKKFTITGDLTIHGITKSVELEGKLNGVIMDENSQKPRAGLKITGSINRLDFEVGEKSPALGDKVNIVVNLEMMRQ